jgi:hypothetical protein
VKVLWHGVAAESSAWQGQTRFELTPMAFIMFAISLQSIV